MLEKTHTIKNTFFEQNSFKKTTSLIVCHSCCSFDYLIHLFNLFNPLQIFACMINPPPLTSLLFINHFSINKSQNKPKKGPRPRARPAQGNNRGKTSIIPYVPPTKTRFKFIQIRNNEYQTYLMVMFFNLGPNCVTCAFLRGTVPLCQ